MYVQARLRNNQISTIKIILSADRGPGRIITVKTVAQDPAKGWTIVREHDAGRSMSEAWTVAGQLLKQLINIRFNAYCERTKRKELMTASNLFAFAVISAVIAVIVGTRVAFPHLDAGYALSFSSDQVGHMLMSVSSSLVTALTALPAEAVAVANGMLYGPVFGFAITWGGALLGASIGFFIARLLGRRAMTRLIGETRIASFDGWTRRYGNWLFLVARLLPFIPFFVLNYGAGLTNMRFGTYLAITAIGIIPIALLCVTFGNEIMATDWPMAVTIAALALLLIGIAYWWRRKENSRSDKTQ